MSVKPIFIFSVPRSGSTLLQRILSVHPDIETKSEMWFLLPFVYTLRNTGVYAQYSSVSLNNAITYLVAQLPNKEQDYFDALRIFSETIYSRLCTKNVRYYVDKTPRYYLIIKEIDRIFPDAKFIFLFRHPLATLASLIESFNQGKLGDYRHKIDIYKGPLLLAEGYKTIKDKSIAIQYETLLDCPHETVKYICDYLSIPYNKSLIEDFHKVPSAPMGDQFGSRKYKTIEKSTTEKWKTILGTKYRKKYAMKYIKHLGEDTIKTFGYDIDKIIIDVNKLETKSTGGFIDRYNILMCNLFTFFEIPMFRKKIKDKLRLGKKNYIHY